MKRILRILLLGLLLFGARAALANPTLCSPGYQDSTCVTPISHGAIPAPQCSTDAGWTTISNAVWLGAQWSQPQCNYQDPPACPAGYTQTSPPSWNGSSWSAPGCSPPVAANPQPTLTCLYDYNHNVRLAPYGNCTADGGCDGMALQVMWGGNGFQTVVFQFWPNDYTVTDTDINQALAGTGYSRGAFMAGGGGNGNASASESWQVCH